MTVNGSSNGSSNTTSSAFFTYAELSPWYIAASVIIAVSCLFGIPANVAVIAKMSRHLRGSSMSQRLFFNLALSDLLCLLCLPVGVLVFYRGPDLTHAVCQLLFFFFFFSVTSDLNILLLISIQRYCQVLHREKWNRLGRWWQRLLLFTVWMLGALLGLPVVFSLEEQSSKYEWRSGRSCRNHRINAALEAFYISFVVVGHLVLFSFYVLLVRGVNRNRLPEKKKTRRPRVTKLFIRMIAVFLAVGFFPLLLRVVYLAARFVDSEALLLVCKKLTFLECFYFFNHCLNPFLYFFASRLHGRENNAKRRILLMPLNDNS